MKVKVDIKPQAIKALSNAQIKAAVLVAEKMRAEIIEEQVIPMNEGFLQNVYTYIEPALAKQGLVSIVHDAPYAARLYYHPEYNFQKTWNANARGLWWDDWLEGSKKKRPSQLFKFFFEKESGGYVK